LDHALQFTIATHQWIELPIHRGLSQIAAEFSRKTRLALTLLRRRFLLRDARELIANLSQFQAALLQNLGREAFSSRSQSQQQMPVPICLCPRRSASSAAYAKTRLHSLESGRSTDGRPFLANRCVCLNLVSDRLYRPCGAQEALVKDLSSRSRPSKVSVSI